MRNSRNYRVRLRGAIACAEEKDRRTFQRPAVSAVAPIDQQVFAFQMDAGDAEHEFDDVAAEDLGLWPLAERQIWLARLSNMAHPPILTALPCAAPARL